jgi:hypothetical protein
MSAGATLEVQTDGNVVYAADRTPLWSRLGN